jgi:hypothetical protein
VRYDATSPYPDVTSGALESRRLSAVPRWRLSSGLLGGDGGRGGL